MFLTSTVAYLETSGTVLRRSSPEIAGTGACLTGSIFMAIVPPVAMNTTTGLVCPATKVANRHRIASVADLTWARMRTSSYVQNIAAEYKARHQLTPIELHRAQLSKLSIITLRYTTIFCGLT